MNQSIFSFISSAISAFSCSILLTGSALAQTPPEIAYVYPPTVVAGRTTDVRIGGYNWTPDMQFFPHDPRVRIELTAPGGPVLVPEPPYWFGKKARDNDFPLPREFPARITVPADVAPGILRWQAANANGATATGVLLVTASADVREQRVAAQPQVLPALPCALVGQVLKLEEVDRYEFTPAKTGPVTIDLATRRFQSKMNAVVEVRDRTGTLVVDAADTAGHDLQLTFSAREKETYTLSLYDVDFRGHHSFVYRVTLHDGPRVVAAVPAGGIRGQTRSVEFFGYGLATGQPMLESVTRDVAFPAVGTAFDYRVETPLGATLPVALGVSDREEIREPNVAAGNTTPLTVPASVTGVLETKFGEDRIAFTAKKGESWTLTARSAVTGSPLDLVLSVVDPAGKELARADDAPGSLDSSLTAALPEDGTYFVCVSDVSGQSGSPAAAYRLTVEPAQPGFTLTIPELLSLPLGGKAVLPIQITRLGGFMDPVTVRLDGLPPGISLPADLTIAMGQPDLKLELPVAADAAVTAGLVTVTASATVNGAALERTGRVVLAITMKLRVKITPEGLDDVRKWPRGSTYPAPVLIERLDGFTGEFLLEQTAYQQRVRQGLTGPDFVVPAAAARIEYPVFMPEWLETTKTSRIILNSVTQVPDPKGTVRHLLQKMELRIGMLPVGAMLKLSHTANELTATPGQAFEVPVTLARSGELTEPATLELHVPPHVAGQFTAETLTVDRNAPNTAFKITPAAGVTGDHELTIRATVNHLGKLPVVSETKFVVTVR